MVREESEPTERRGCVLVSSSAVGGFVLRWWNRFVGLARGSVHGLNPQQPILLVVTGEHDQVSLFHRVEEHPTTLQTWGGGEV